MADNTQEQLLDEFAGLFKTAAEDAGQASQGMTPQAAGSVAQTPAGTDTHGGTPAQTTSGVSAGSVAETMLEGGFGIVPLISGLVGLFSGGASQQPALEKYEMPSSIAFSSAETGGQLTASDFDQTGAPRAYNPAADASSGGTTAAAGQASGQAITVNVQAMDAQSFMDYSTQIAQAVRGAMLNMSSVNDVVSEL